MFVAVKAKLIIMANRDLICIITSMVLVSDPNISCYQLSWMIKNVASTSRAKSELARVDRESFFDKKLDVLFMGSSGLNS